MEMTQGCTQLLKLVDTSEHKCSSQVQEMTAVRRIAMQNAVAVRVVDTAAQNLRDSQLAVSFDFSLHPWLPLVQLKR